MHDSSSLFSPIVKFARLDFNLTQRHLSPVSTITRQHLALLRGSLPTMEESKGSPLPAKNAVPVAAKAFTPIPELGDREYPGDCPITVHTFADDGAPSVTEYSWAVFQSPDFSLPTDGVKMRWVHVPVNQMAWVEVRLKSQVVTFLRSIMRPSDMRALGLRKEVLSHTDQPRRLGDEATTYPGHRSTRHHSQPLLLHGKLLQRAWTLEGNGTAAACSLVCKSPHVGPFWSYSRRFC